MKTNLTDEFDITAVYMERNGMNACVDQRGLLLEYRNVPLAAAESIESIGMRNLPAVI